MSWCFQCGVAGKPERAVGWDEDGEPACGLHRVKADRPLKFKDVSRGSTHGLAPERVAEKSSPTIPAAPSPVQIKQEKEMKTFKPRTCVCGCNETFEPTGTTQRFKEGHKPAKVKSRAITKRPRKVREVLMPNPFADQRIDRLTDHVNREIGGAQDVPLHQRVDNGAGSATTERVITLQLGESKVQKLLDLLLQ